MPRVSIHIVTYNSASTIDPVLEAALGQDYDDFELLLIDNASTDDTLSTAARYPVRLIENTQNVGYSAAQNQGLRATDSDYVLTLNPDALLMPGFIAAMVDALEPRPAVGSASGKLLRVDRLGETPTTIDGAGIFMRRNRHQGLRYENMAVEALPDAIHPIFGPDGACAFYRRRMLEDIAVGGEIFDEDFYLHKGDIDINWRAQLRGWQSVCVPGAVAHHIRRFRPGHRERVDWLERCCSVRNRYLLAIKNELGGHFWGDSWSIALYDIGIVGYLIINERKSLCAFHSVWKLRHKMLQKRRVIQSRRTADAAAIRQWFRGHP